MSTLAELSSSRIEVGTGYTAPVVSSFSCGTYEATEDRGRRKLGPKRTAAEDRIATEKRRAIMSASGHDMVRNFVIAKAMIRTHLNYVSSFSFQGKTPDRNFNLYLQNWWIQQAKKKNFDIARRHPWRRALRIAEACKVIEGDCGWLKIAPPKGNPWRGKRQMIEGARICLPRGDAPRGAKPEEWIGGVRVDLTTGEALEVAISRRTKSGMKLDRIVPESDFNMHAAYEFRYDQVRGVSMIAAGLAWMRDTFEAFEFANAKLKLGQLFGLQVYSNTQTMNWERSDDGYEVDFGRGPFVLELDEGDKADILQSKTQSSDDTNYLDLLILICYKALELPYSMWDASKGKFHGNKTELIQYQKSTKDRIADLQDFATEDAEWRMAIAVADGELKLPPGKDLDYLQFEFVPAGTPPWDAAKEYRGSAMGIAAGLTSPYREAQLLDTDFEQNILETEAALKFADDHNVPLKYDDKDTFAPELTVAGIPNG